MYALNVKHFSAETTMCRSWCCGMGIRPFLPSRKYTAYSFLGCKVSRRWCWPLISISCQSETFLRLRHEENLHIFVCIYSCMSDARRDMKWTGLWSLCVRSTLPPAWVIRESTIKFQKYLLLRMCIDMYRVNLILVSVCARPSKLYEKLKSKLAGVKSNSH